METTYNNLSIQFLDIKTKKEDEIFKLSSHPSVELFPWFLDWIYTKLNNPIFQKSADFYIYEPIINEIREFQFLFYKPFLDDHLKKNESCYKEKKPVKTPPLVYTWDFETFSKLETFPAKIFFYKNKDFFNKRQISFESFL